MTRTDFLGENKTWEYLHGLGVTKRHRMDLQRGIENTPFFKANKKYLEIDSSGEFVCKNPILIFNECGIGKSFLAQQMVVEAFKFGNFWRIIKGEELQARFECLETDGGFHRTNSFENIASLADFDGLIIDEADNIKKTEVLNRLLGHLHDNCVRFVLIGNCALNDFLATLEPKIVDRLLDKHYGAEIIGGQYDSVRSN